MQASDFAHDVFPRLLLHNRCSALHRHLLTLYHAFRGFLFLLLLPFLSLDGLGRLGRLWMLGLLGRHHAGCAFLPHCPLGARHGSHLAIAHFFAITHLVTTHHLATLFP